MFVSTKYSFVSLSVRVIPLSGTSTKAQNKQQDFANGPPNKKLLSLHYAAYFAQSTTTKSLGVFPFHQWKLSENIINL
jgi:hypothetical protein